MSKTSGVPGVSARRRAALPPLVTARGPAEERHPAIALELYGDLADVAGAWTALETHTDCTAFQAYHWLLKWLRHVGTPRGVRPAIVLGRDRNGEPLVILPLAIERRGLARRLPWLGSEHSPYNAPLVSRHFSEQVDSDGFKSLWHEALALLRADRRFHFDVVDLEKMPERLGERRNPCLALPTVPHPRCAHLATLGDDWESFYAAKRSAAAREREQRQLRQLADYGKIRFLELEEQADIRDTLDTLFAQRARSLAGMGDDNSFARPGPRAFLLDLAADPGSRDLVHVSRLEVGALTAAVSVALRFHSTYSLVLSSCADGDIARLDPGRAHLHELMCRAIGRGFRVFDFTIAEEPYIRDWCDIEMTLHDHLSAATIWGLPVVAATTAFRRAKRPMT
jgi:CelD/BcsL family acetyltransferase involved in cellulose biosynthesis